MVEIGPTLGAGTMTLTQAGSDVSGIASGATLTGTWHGPSGHGQLALTLATGDGSFTGTWKDAAGGRFSAGSTWDGTCQSGTCAQAATVSAQAPGPLGLGPRLLVGGVDDAAEWGSPLASMELAKRAGFEAIVLSSVWASPLRAPPQPELDRLATAVAAAEELGIEPIVAVYSFASSTPLSEGARGRFASYAAAIARAIPELRYMSIGNEPNSGVFWLPQFGSNGSDVAAPAYFRLLTQTDELLARTAPGLTVIGGSLAARGRDRPGGGGSEPVADEVHPRSRHGLSGERAHPTSDGHVFHPPVSGQLEHPAVGDPSELDDDRHRRLCEARLASAGGLRGAAPDRLRRVRHQHAHPAWRPPPLHRPPRRHGRPGERGRQPTTSRRSGSPSASRSSACSCSSTSRTREASAASRAGSSTPTARPSRAFPRSPPELGVQRATRFTAAHPLSRLGELAFARRTPGDPASTCGECAEPTLDRPRNGEVLG